MSHRETDVVVVVGAGVAGLIAANDLVAAGRDVVVLEARDRVGGRLLNIEICGEPNELGGQWIAPYQSEMQALVPELGLELFDAYREGDHVYVDADGVAHRYHGSIDPLPEASARAYEGAVATLDALVAEIDPEAPWKHRAQRSSTQSRSSSGSPLSSTTHSPATSCVRTWPVVT